MNLNPAWKLIRTLRGNVIQALFRMFKLVKTVLGIKSYKMVLVVRSDLKMNAGKTAIQCSHASIELFKQALEQKSSTLKLWGLFGQPKIVLKAPSEEILMQIHEDAKKRKINTSLIYDSDSKIQTQGDIVTVCGIGPHIGEDVDILTKHLKLL